MSLTDATDSIGKLIKAVEIARREVIVLGVEHGLTWTDLARVTGLSLDAVKNIARSGRQDRSG